MTVEQEIDRATTFGQQLEDIIVKKVSFTLSNTGDRDKLLLAFWSLALDLDKSILNLMQNKFYGGAFALLRPLVEAQIRAHVVLMASEDIVEKVKNDTYSVNFKTIGGEIDTAFQLDGYFDRFLNGARDALHSFAHSGVLQLGRRFHGNDLEAHYEDDDIIEVINISSAATWMVTNLVAKHFNLNADAKIIEELFIERGKH